MISSAFVLRHRVHPKFRFDFIQHYPPSKKFLQLIKVTLRQLPNPYSYIGMHVRIHEDKMENKYVYNKSCSDPYFRSLFDPIMGSDPQWQLLWQEQSVSGASSSQHNQNQSQQQQQEKSSSSSTIRSNTSIVMGSMEPRVVTCFNELYQPRYHAMTINGILKGEKVQELIRGIHIPKSVTVALLEQVIIGLGYKIVLQAKDIISSYQRLIQQRHLHRDELLRQLNLDS